MRDTVRWRTECPRCQAKSSVYLNAIDNPPDVKCGSCLFDDQEIVDLVCTKVEDEQ